MLWKCLNRKFPLIFNIHLFRKQLLIICLENQMKGKLRISYEMNFVEIVPMYSIVPFVEEDSGRFASRLLS